MVESEQIGADTPVAPGHLSAGRRADRSHRSQERTTAQRAFTPTSPLSFLPQCGQYRIASPVAAAAATALRSSQCSTGTVTPKAASAIRVTPTARVSPQASSQTSATNSTPPIASSASAAVSTHRCPGARCACLRNAARAQVTAATPHEPANFPTVSPEGVVQTRATARGRKPTQKPRHHRHWTPPLKIEERHRTLAKRLISKRDLAPPDEPDRRRGPSSQRRRAVPAAHRRRLCLGTRHATQSCCDSSEGRGSELVGQRAFRDERVDL